MAVLHQNLPDEPGKGQLRNDRIRVSLQLGNLLEGPGLGLLGGGRLAAAR